MSHPSDVHPRVDLPTDLGRVPQRHVDTSQAPPPVALVLSAQAVDARSRRAAMAVVLVSTLIFACIVPFAKHRLDAYPIFIPLIQTALILNDFITALLLFMQLRVTRSRALLVLACGYVYTTLLAASHLLTFPGVFAPSGLLGAGPQTTAYLFVFWHCGFPVAVITYMLLKDREPPRPAARIPVVGIPLGLTVLAALALLVLATRGHHLLVPMLDGNAYSSPFNVARYGQWALTALAIWVVWRHERRSILDLWLLVALCASFIEIGLVAIFNAGRYDIGFYAGRIYALLSSVFVLAVLLYEQARLYSGVFAASQALQDAEAQARASRDVLSLAMAGGGMGAWTLRPGSGDIWISVELEAILGFAPGTLKATPRSLLKRVHRDDIPGVRRALTEAVESGRDFLVAVRFFHPQGRWRWMEIRGRAGAAGEERAATVMGVAMDVTVQHDAQAALRDADRRKDEFIAILAHELRNPLAPIRNAVGLMKMLAPLPPEIERIRGIVDRQSLQLARLVDDLFDVSCITQGKVQLRKERACVNDILRDALDATAPAAHAAGHEVVVNASDTQLSVEADVGRLTQVFVNLLHNAIKFTPPGGRISVSSRHEEDAAVVSVRDSGIGIEPHHQDAIFGIFSQLQSSLDAGRGGLGVGLALVRGFVELHGGSVHVNSAGHGRGTEFTLRLPLSPTAAA